MIKFFKSVYTQVYGSYSAVGVSTGKMSLVDIYQNVKYVYPLMQFHFISIQHICTRTHVQRFIHCIIVSNTCNNVNVHQKRTGEIKYCIQSLEYYAAMIEEGSNMEQQSPICIKLRNKSVENIIYYHLCFKRVAYLQYINIYACN